MTNKNAVLDEASEAIKPSTFYVLSGDSWWVPHFPLGNVADHSTYQCNNGAQFRQNSHNTWKSVRVSLCFDHLALFAFRSHWIGSMTLQVLNWTKCTWHVGPNNGPMDPFPPTTLYLSMIKSAMSMSTMSMSTMSMSMFGLWSMIIYLRWLKGGKKEIAL